MKDSVEGSHVRDEKPHFCAGDKNPIEKDCPACVDKLYGWAQTAQETINETTEALKDAIERMEASNPPHGGATWKVLVRCYKAVRVTIPDYT
jgi:hypothetical protein